MKGPTLVFGVFQKLFSFRVFSVVRGQPIPVSSLQNLERIGSEVQLSLSIGVIREIRG
jgi:hypothetical protein